MSDSTAFEDWLEALPYDERATLCFKKVWDAAQACKDDPQQRTYCLKHYRQTFPGKGCDMCEMEARIEALKAAIGNINTQKEIVMKYAKESDRLMAVGRMYQAIADAAALLQEPTND